jgi:nephrocystin-3
MSLFKRLFGKDKQNQKPELVDHQNEEKSIQENKTFTKKSNENIEAKPPKVSVDKKATEVKPSKLSMPDKRSIRVFISSTFRDMMEERDTLMTHTWPELRKFCRERHVELVEVDLRWGIAEEQSTRKETLKLCLDEIRACRPFFIGLLGERYGWMPGEDAFTKDLIEEQPWLNETNGKSVTELEILHGVLNDPEMASRAFFYFRDPKYIDSIPEKKKKDFLSEDAATAEKQVLLKNEIRILCAAKNIPLLETYPNPKSLAAIILEQLKDAIDKKFPIEEVPDSLTRQALDHEAFAEIRRRTYIGRPDYYEVLDRHCTGIGKPLLLLGDSGSGKSALIANWVQHWKNEHPKDFIFQHYIGGSSDSAVHWKIMTRLISEIKKWSDDCEELPKTNDDILRDFAVWLAKARLKAAHDGIKFIVILDALNQLEDKDYAHILGWLPTEPFRDNLRLIVSTLPGDTLEAIEKRGIEIKKVEPLTSDEKKKMTVDYLKRYGKTLDTKFIDRLAKTDATSNPLYLKILLDELRVTGTFDNLEKRLNDYLSAKDIPSLLQKVLTRYQKDYEHDRKGLVGEALGLIWSARRGLTESELLQLLKPDNLPQLPLAIWSPLRAALEDSLIDRGGILNFAHDFLCYAVEKAFVTNESKRQVYFSHLITFFESHSVNERTCDELPFLIKHTGDIERLRKLLLNIDCFVLIQKRDEDELLNYWLWLKEDRIMGKYYNNTFESWANDKKDPKVANVVANDLAYFLAFRADLPKDSEKLMFRARNYDAIILGENHPSVAIRCNNLGMLLQNIFRYKEAELQYRRAIAIDESFGLSSPALARDISNLATLLIATCHYPEAELLIKRALSIDENCFGQNHPIVAIRLGILGELYFTTNRFAEAKPLLRRALEIDELNYGRNNLNFANRLKSFAEFLNDDNQNKNAEIHMRQALEICENCFGPNHPKVSGFLEVLAGLLIKTGRLKDAEPLIKKALVINEKAFGLNHPNVANSFCLLANFYLTSNKLSEVEMLLNKALTINEHFFGKMHTAVASNLNELGYFLRLTNQLDLSEKTYRKSLAIYEEHYGQHHSTVSKILTNLAQVVQALNRLEEAEKLMKRALLIAENCLGLDNPDVAICLNNLGQLFKVNNRLDEAEPLLIRALAILENSFGQEHPKVAIALNNIGTLLLDRGKFREAEQYIIRALSINEKILGPNHANLAFPLMALSESLHTNGKSTEAEIHCKRALDILVNSFGYYHPQVANCLNRLGLISCAINKSVQSELQMKKAIEILLKNADSTDKSSGELTFVINNYITILQVNGKTSDQIYKILNEIGDNYHVNINNLVKKIGNTPSNSLVIVIKSLMCNQAKTNEIIGNLKQNNYKLYLELSSWFNRQ